MYMQRNFQYIVIFVATLIGVSLIVGVMGMITPKTPNCEPAIIVQAFATQHNDVFVKAILNGQEMYKLDKTTRRWIELPLDVDLRFNIEVDGWTTLENGERVNRYPESPDTVSIGGQRYTFCLPRK